jgi:flagellar motor switch protein FliG
MALKGANDRLKDRFVSNMSDRVAGMLKEDIEFMGPVRMSDVEDVQLRVVQTVRQLEDAGQVTVVRGDVNDVFV